MVFQVCSFSQLFRDFRDDDAFIACGREFLPVELRDANRHLRLNTDSSPVLSDQHDLASDSALGRPLRDQKPVRLDRYEQLDGECDVFPRKRTFPLLSQLRFLAENPISAESDLNIDDYPQATDNSSESVPPSARVEPCRVFVRSATRTLWPPNAEDRADPNTPRKAMQLDWVYPAPSRQLLGRYRGRVEK